MLQSGRKEEEKNALYQYKNINFKQSELEMDQYSTLQLLSWRSNVTSYGRTKAYVWVQ
jgi:hypothetical protein